MISPPKKYDVIIIGAGAAGLALNYQLSGSGLDVLLLERQNRAGRKLLISGGGKCNVTNLNVDCFNYLGQNSQFCEHALACLPPSEILDFLDEHRLSWEEREHGQIFLKRGAHELRDLLVRLGKEQGGAPLLGAEVVAVNKSTDGFDVKTANGRFAASKLVIAAGGPAWPACGANGSGFDMANSFGHTIIPPSPALTPLSMPKEWPFKELSGINPFVRISTLKADAKSYALPLMITHQGISGPAALQISGWLAEGEEIVIDWLPGENCEDLFNEPGAGKLLLFNLLSRKLPARLVRAIVAEEIGFIKVAELSRKIRENVTNCVHNYRVAPIFPDFSRAEACRGGVSTVEIDPYSMESLLIPNLYFAGEIMDVCGELGGYNLHWAWASARVAFSAICGL